MLAGSLQKDLLAIPGIAGAVFEGADDQPAGVRVQLAIGADPGVVGREVQRVLASHGMRSQMADEPAPGSVVNLSDYEAVASPQAPEPVEPARPVEPAVEVIEAAALDSAVSDAAAEEAVSRVAVGEPVPPPAAVARPPAAVAMSGIAGVSVEEDDNGVRLTVRTSAGNAVVRRVAALPGDVDTAAITAVAELAAGDVPARLVAITDSIVEGSPIVTVVFEIGVRRVAGAAVVRGSRPFAVARAAWSALRP